MPPLPPIPAPPFSRPLHILAWLTACAVFPLIFLGGLVTTNHAGLSVPDWPNSYGYNMFLFPPSFWIGGIFFEHTHRLLATVVGFLSILLVLQSYAPARNPRPRFYITLFAILSLAIAATFAIIMFATGNTDPLLSPTAGYLSQFAVAFASLFLILTASLFPRQREPRPWVRKLSLAILASVIFQGLLGGLRVVFVNLDLAILHACVAQAFFCLAAFMVLTTSPRWPSLPTSNQQLATSNSSSLPRLALLTLTLIYLQLIAGATMRHFNAGLAIPDLPLAYGHLIPPLSSDALPAINAARSADPLLEPVTLGQIWLHFSHRIGALLVTLSLLTLITHILLHHRHIKSLTRPAILLIFLLLTQLTLGTLTVLLRKPAEIATAHVAVGALVLVTTFVLFVRSHRLYAQRKKNIITTPVAPMGAQPIPS